MEKTENKNPIYAPVTLEFVTVALEYCSFLEKADEGSLFAFVDKATKLLPLLYLKAALLPPIEPDEEAELETTVTEAMYDDLRGRLSGLLGERDVFLDTFHEDMRYSDTPIASAISGRGTSRSCGRRWCFAGIISAITGASGCSTPSARCTPSVMMKKKV